MKRLMTAWLLSAIVLGISISGRAQDTADHPSALESGETPQYRRLIEQAIEENNAQNFAEALALFREAHGLWPNARTFRGIGMMEFELKNYTDSVEQLQLALASAVKRLEGPMRKATEQLLARARTYVANVKLEIRPSAPPGTQMTLDGAPLSEQRRDVLMLGIGPHTFRVRAPGYEETTQSINIKDARDQRVVIELAGAEHTRSAPSLATRALPASASDRPLLRNPWLWTGVGAVVVGGVIAGIVLASSGGHRAQRPIPGDIGGVVEALTAR